MTKKRPFPIGYNGGPGHEKHPQIAQRRGMSGFSRKWEVLGGFQAEFLGDFGPFFPKITFFRPPRTPPRGGPGSGPPPRGGSGVRTPPEGGVRPDPPGGSFLDPKSPKIDPF